MIVVSGTSPILNLSAVGHLDLLKQLYQQLLIPPAVATELHAGRVLIDERRSRKIALEFELQPLGLLGVLAKARQRGFLPECKSVLDDMIRIAGFWIGERLYKIFLQQMGESA